jgi:indolepyruvate ferredoxin oxidoreductase beta subunit
MKQDFVLAGVGGQGVVSIGAILAWSGRQDGLVVKMAEVHGMAQRGGSVHASLRVSDQPIHGALIPEGTADGILSTEPLESLRYLDLLSPEGVVITSTDPEINIPDYPEPGDVLARLRALPRAVLVDADRIARDCGSARAKNVVMVGAASSFLPVKPETIESAIRGTFGRKGEKVVEMNLRAFRAGRETSACVSS